jgi:hypothetical protein
MKNLVPKNEEFSSQKMMNLVPEKWYNPSTRRKRRPEMD